MLQGRLKRLPKSEWNLPNDTWWPIDIDCDACIWSILRVPYSCFSHVGNECCEECRRMSGLATDDLRADVCILVLLVPAWPGCFCSFFCVVTVPLLWIPRTRVRFSDFLSESACVRITDLLVLWGCVTRKTNVPFGTIREDIRKDYFY